MRFQRRGRGVGRAVAFGMLALGTVFLIVGLVTAGMSASLLADSERVPGTVVKLEWRKGGHETSRDGPRDQVVAYPVVAYTPEGGVPTRFRGSTGSNPPSYEEGEQVEVLYRPGSPGDARINGFASLWMLPLIFGGTGLLFVGIGAATVRARRRRAAGASSP
ncbi:MULTISPECIES: DUF3592 domain-containing protein, partial [Streptomyces]|uniref:DUF3592 domain-containing protein n=1 Tax=Streptomyces cacaoi TaxID=1898 RepID=A0A4Y3R332_STRCI